MKKLVQLMNQFQIDLVVYKILSPLLYLKHRKANPKAAGSILYFTVSVVCNSIISPDLSYSAGSELWQ